MKNYMLLTATAFTLIAATPVKTDTLAIQAGSRIWVNGGSTVKNYKCAATAFESSVLGTSTAPKDVEVAKLVRAAEISVPVKSLECGNGTMNEHMRKALKITENPNITFKLISYTMGATNTVTLKGDLTIAGKTLPVDLTGTVTEDAGVVHAMATREINMKDWGVKPPSLMLGTMKVKELATIGFDVLLKR